MAAQSSGAGALADRVAMEPADHFRLSRAPHMKYKYLLADGAQTNGRALEYFRRGAEQTDSASTCAVANERESVCEAIRILYAPYAPPGKAPRPPGDPFGGTDQGDGYPPHFVPNGQRRSCGYSNRKPILADVRRSPRVPHDVQLAPVEGGSFSGGRPAVVRPQAAGPKRHSAEGPRTCGDAAQVDGSYPSGRRTFLGPLSEPQARECVQGFRAQAAPIAQPLPRQSIVPGG